MPICSICGFNERHGVWIGQKYPVGWLKLFICEREIPKENFPDWPCFRAGQRRLEEFAAENLTCRYQQVINEEWAFCDNPQIVGPLLAERGGCKVNIKGVCENCEKKA